MGLNHGWILPCASGSEEVPVPTQQCRGLEGWQEGQVCPSSCPRGLIRHSGEPEEGL